MCDAYVAARGLNPSQEIGVYWPFPGESTSPDDLFHHILNDYNGHPGLLSQLSSRPGFSVTDPSHDVKALVLCYGIPLMVSSSERTSSVDAVLSLLFSDASASNPLSVDTNKSWGVMPIGIGINNHYNPASQDGGGVPMDFGVFRTSVYNDVAGPPPGFTITRMFDDTHAVAAGGLGILYCGVCSSGAWDWEPVLDPNKGFIYSQVSDIYVIDANTAIACTALGSYLETQNAGQTWVPESLPGSPSGIPRSFLSLSTYDTSGDWWAVVATPLSSSTYSYGLWRSDNMSGPTGSLPSGFTPAYVAAADSASVWVSGSGGIYHSTNAGTSWTDSIYRWRCPPNLDAG